MRPVKMTLEEYAIKNGKMKLLREYCQDNLKKPCEIGTESREKVRWCCEHGHKIFESPRNHINRGYCPICGKEGLGSLAQVFPEVLEYWSPNNTLDPNHIPSSYTCIAEWQCSCGHTWSRRIHKQVANNTCPICELGEKSLISALPELIDEWNYEKNGDADIMTLSAYSNKKFYWICPNGHEYIKSPAELMRRKMRCQQCNSLGFLYPKIIPEWHPTKNGNKTPYDYAATSQVIAWFVCSYCGEDYTARIADRAKRKSPRCPNCRGKG